VESLVTDKPCRYTNKTGLQALNREAERRSYNRQIMEDAIDQLPADVLIAVMPVMIHEHAQGKPVDPHLRCFIFADPDPVGLNRVMLDVPIEMFELLTAKETLAELAKKFNNEPAGKQNAGTTPEEVHDRNVV
jgi:hypothetical protein